MFTATLRRSRIWARSAVHSPRRLISSNHQTFAEGDIVHLRRIAGKTSSTILSKRLKPGGITNTPTGPISHNAIIGANTRDIITTRNGTGYCVTFPTIDEYVTKIRRIVTPVYPNDGAAIVNLLDIHVDAAPETPLEIFEAGTGHGSLTLQLCRAVHAANPPGAPRGAIIHTIDISARHSANAVKVIAGFRRGLYSKNVDFYVDNPNQWIADQLAKRVEEGKKSGPFLSHAILDLPGSDKYLRAVADGLLPDGALGVFCPSITQIADCLKLIKKEAIPLSKEVVVEFPPHGMDVGAGLRAWNVKWTTVRAREREKAEIKGEEGNVETEAEGEEALAESESADVESESADAESESADAESESADAESESADADAQMQPNEISSAAVEGQIEDVLVCRPSVGDRMVGGGFFVVFRKKGQS